MLHTQCSDNRYCWLGLMSLAMALCTCAGLWADDPVGSEESVAHATAPNEALVRQALADRAVRRALSANAELDFIETPLSDVIAYLEDVHQIQIELDGAAVAQGVNDDTPVTRNLTGIPLSSAIRLLLRDFQLTTVVDDGVLLITTEEAANSRRFTLVESVEDLAPDEESIQQLMQTLELALDADPASRMSIFRGQLVIRASRPQLDEINNLLATLRSRLGLDPVKATHPFSRWNLGRSANLSRTQVTGDDLFYLTDQDQIETLDLSFTETDDRGVAHLTHLSNLKSLNLRRTQVTDQAIASLAQLKKLENLDISASLLTDDGLGSLAELKSLQQLTIGSTYGRNPVSDSVMEPLQKALPQCQITVHQPPARRPGRNPFDPFGTPGGAGADPFGDEPEPR